MSCIVGVLEGTRVWIGADSACVDSAAGQTLAIADPKVFYKCTESQSENVLIAGIGSFRIIQAVRYGFAVPPINTTDGLSYMIRDFVPALKEHLCALGLLLSSDTISEEDCGDRMIGSTSLLVGFVHKRVPNLFTVGVDFHVIRFQGNYTAEGSGASVALGSLFTSKRIKDTEKRIKTALAASAHFCNTVCGPFDVESLSV